MPVGARVTLEVDRPEYFLGENVLVHFILENTGSQPFEADFGGDYRGTTRGAYDEIGRQFERQLGFFRWREKHSSRPLKRQPTWALRKGLY